MVLRWALRAFNRSDIEIRIAILSPASPTNFVCTDKSWKKSWSSSRMACSTALQSTAPGPPFVQMSCQELHLRPLCSATRISSSTEHAADSVIVYLCATRIRKNSLLF